MAATTTTTTRDLLELEELAAHGPIREAIRDIIMHRAAVVTPGLDLAILVGNLESIRLDLLARLTAQGFSELDAEQGERFRGLVSRLLQELVDANVLHRDEHFYGFAPDAGERLWAWAGGKAYPSAEPYGQALAQRVASFLLRGGSIQHDHRDYCGMGLWTESGTIVYGGVMDGGYDRRASKRWTDPAAFIDWLAAQSDHSLFGFEEPARTGNQRIMRSRLITCA